MHIVAETRFKGQPDTDPFSQQAQILIVQGDVVSPSVSANFKGLACFLQEKKLARHS